MFQGLFFEAAKPTEIGENVIFDMFMALQVPESCNPLETVRKVFARQLSQEERFFGVKSGEPDLRAFIVVRAALPERQPFRAHVFLVHLFSRPNTESDVRLRRKKSALLNCSLGMPKIVRYAFIPF